MVGLSNLRRGRSWPVPPTLLLACAAIVGCGTPEGPAAVHHDAAAQVQSVPAAEQSAPPTSNAAWTSASSMNEPRYGHAARRLTSGRVLVAGGFTDQIPAAIPGGGSNVVSASVEAYDPAQDEWFSLPWMSWDRIEHAMVTLPGAAPPDGAALVMGGRSDFGEFLSGAEIFDGQSWLFTAPLFEARAGHSATRLGDDRVLVAGGYNDGGGGSGSSVSALGGAPLGGAGYSYLCSTEIYDPAAASGNGDWIGTGSLSTCRANHTETLLLGDRVMVAGGEDDLDALASVEMWSPITGTWATVAPMATARTRHTATLLMNGKILVVGGTDGFADLAGAELYDPMTDTWAAVGQLSIGRSQHAAVLLGNGRVLVVGGYGGGSPLATAEIFDPATNMFTATVPMLTPRALGSATLLASGDVLVAGGDIGVGSPPITGAVEVFSPTGGAGGPCDVAGDCGTGFCVDGVCCDAACDQTCEACTAALRGDGGQDGTCGPVVKGQDPAGECAAMPAATCGTTGLCDGGGSCEVHPAGTVCQPAACMGTVAQPQGSCDGDATCLQGAAKDCAPYACATGACLGNCKVQTDCAPTAYCDAIGTCNPKLGDGSQAANPVQCLSGFAVDGVCCNEACDQECHTCAKDLGAVTDGVCSPLSDVQCDDGTACTKVDVCQAGACVGMQLVNCPADTGCSGGLGCNPDTGQCTVQLAPKSPGDPCDDGDVCTTGETCDAASVCAGSAVDCVPNECQSGGQCVEGVGCQFDAFPDFTECTKDTNPCTVEVCKSGMCLFSNNLDGAPCPGGTCFAGQCLLEGGGTGSGAGGAIGTGGGTGTGGAGAGGPAGGSDAGAGGAAGDAGAGGDAAGYTLLGGACAVPASGGGAPGSFGAALALLGLAGLRRRRRD